MSLKDQTCFITGATSGIGWAAAEAIARAGANVILTGRRQQRLEELKEKIESEYGTKAHTLCFDLQDTKATQEVLEGHRSVLENVTVLINNAGLAKGTEPLDQGHFEDWEQMIDTNIKGTLLVTRFFLPILKKCDGHVLNLGSVAGRWIYPGGAVYSTTKMAMGALTEGIRLDMADTNVRVTNIMPGSVETEFSDVRLGDKEKAKAVYEGYRPLTAGDIAESIVWSLDRPAHVNIQEMVIYPTDQKAVRVIKK